MRLSGLFGLAMLGGAFLLPSCGGDDDDSVASGGKGGSAGKGGSSGKGGASGKAGASGKGGSAGKGTGGSAGKGTVGGSSGSGQAGDDSGGESGNGGVSGEAGGGTGGNAGQTNNAGAAGEPGDPDPQSTACSAFPETVTLGESISVDTYGAVLCAATSPTACRLTTNTYSDGVNPCDNADATAIFLASTGDNTLRLMSTWHVNSATAGTINTSFDYVLSGIPASTSVTAVVENPDGDTFSLVFEFGAGRAFTITSFTAVI